MMSPPELLREDHDVAGFCSGVDALDSWLTQRALQNQRQGATRTYVVCHEGRVIGYHAIASGALATAGATGKLRPNMPDPIPMAVLARLAVSTDWQGRGLGAALFRDAALRVLAAADVIGIRGLMVHAINDRAVRFYRALGLRTVSADDTTLMTTVDDLRAALGS